MTSEQVTLSKARILLADRRIEIRDIAREVYSRHYIHYPHATISAFLIGDLKPRVLAFKVIRHTIQEAFGMEIIHGQNFQPVADATQGKEV